MAHEKRTPISSFTWDFDNKFISYLAFNDDTTREQAEGIGKDVQGIPWRSHPEYSRSKYRFERMSYCDTFPNTVEESKPLGDLSDVEDRFISNENGCFYNFRQNVRAASCSMTHFQLRHLVSATSPYQVYHMDDFSIWEWNGSASKNKLRGTQTKVMDLKKGGVGGLSNQYEDDPGMGVLVSTMAANENLVAVGGFKGECIVKNVSTESIVFNKRLTDNKSAITNYIDLNGDKTLISSNDHFVRIFDTGTFTMTQSFSFGYCINNAVKKDKMMTLVGDTDVISICEVESGKELYSLKGHLDFSFASAWHPCNSHIVATGSQDNTIRIWDLRKADKSLKAIVGCLGAIRSLRYSEDGKFLAASEPADFVHVYDVGADYTREQQLDIFGEVTGIAFGRGDGGLNLFVGVFDKNYKSLMEFERNTIATVDTILL
ncbi:WD repeat-containing protein [Acrasis kona]|uniref:WD repeat-containing protein n=1 Tax=Acrasis kona TaxID=1008807 RepID=A0AAW2ZNA5_9EUKA